MITQTNLPIPGDYWINYRQLMDWHASCVSSEFENILNIGPNQWKCPKYWTDFLAFSGVLNQSGILIFGPDRLFSGFLEPYHYCVINKHNPPRYFVNISNMISTEDKHVPLVFWQTGVSKQCRHKPGAKECSVWFRSTLFTYHPSNFRHFNKTCSD